jgi:hypothetical protein
LTNLSGLPPWIVSKRFCLIVSIQAPCAASVKEDLRTVRIAEALCFVVALTGQNFNQTKAVPKLQFWNSFPGLSGKTGLLTGFSRSLSKTNRVLDRLNYLS